MKGTSVCDQSAVAPSSRDDGASPAADSKAPKSGSPRQDDAFRAWRDWRSGAAMAAARSALDPQEIQIVKSTGLARFFRLRKAGIDGSDVIAGCLPRRRADIEQAIYEQVLPGLNVPTPRYYGSIAADGGKRQWVFVEDAAGENYLPRDPECRVAAARWLAALHVGAVAAGPELASLNLPEHGEPYYREHLRVSLAVLKRRLDSSETGLPLSDEAVALIKFFLEACAVSAKHWDEVCALVAAAPRTIIHGDAAPRNFRVRRDRTPATLMCFDWEDAAWAPPALDLIHADPHATCDALNPDIAAYVSETRLQWPGLDFERVQRLGAVGRLFWNLLAIRLDAEAMPDHHLEWRLSNLRLYGDELVEVFGDLGWPIPARDFDPGSFK